jgi:hypothetical protein
MDDVMPGIGRQPDVGCDGNHDEYCFVACVIKTTVYSLFEALG